MTCFGDFPISVSDTGLYKLVGRNTETGEILGEDDNIIVTSDDFIYPLNSVYYGISMPASVLREIDGGTGKMRCSYEVIYQINFCTPDEKLLVSKYFVDLVGLSGINVEVVIDTIPEVEEDPPNPKRYEECGSYL